MILGRKVNGAVLRVRAARKVFHLQVDGVRNGQAFAVAKRPKVITSSLQVIFSTLDLLYGTESI